MIGSQGKQKHPGTDPGTHPQNDHQPPKPKPPGYSFRHYDHPTEAEHRTAEQFNWRYSYALNICIAIIVAFTFIAAGGSFYETRRQAHEAAEQTVILRNTLIASNRAWLALKIEIISDLKPQIDGENIAVRVSAQNFGHSPALGAYLSMEFHANHIFDNGPEDALKRACHYGHTDTLLTLSKSGRVVVPGAPYVWERSATASVEDIDDALRSINEHSPGRPMTTLPIMSVLICVTYATPEDSILHQTAISRDVYRKVLNSETGMGYLARGITVPRGELLLSDFFPGDYAD